MSKLHLLVWADLWSRSCGNRDGTTLLKLFVVSPVKPKEAEFLRVTI